MLAAGPPLTRAPLTLIVNGHTASTSEIFTGALRDNCRALLVGTRHVMGSRVFVGGNGRPLGALRLTGLTRLAAGLLLL